MYIWTHIHFIYRNAYIHAVVCMNIGMHVGRYAWEYICICPQIHIFDIHACIRWVPLKLDFLGAWKSVRLKHYLAYPIIIISIIIQRNLATKIQAKQESGLTAVWLKQDPPVYQSIDGYIYVWMYVFMHICMYIYTHTTYMHGHMCVCTHVCMCICYIYVHMHLCMYVCMLADMYIWIHSSVYAHTCLFMYMYKYIHTHVHMHRCMQYD